MILNGFCDMIPLAFKKLLHARVFFSPGAAGSGQRYTRQAAAALARADNCRGKTQITESYQTDVTIIAEKKR